MKQQPAIRLGDLFRSRRQRGRAGLPVISVTMDNGLVDRDSLDRKNNGTLTPEAHLLIRKGDIAYNMMRMWQGASGLAEGDGIVSPAYVVVTPKDAIDPLYAAYWFKSTRMIHLFWAYSYGITSDRLRLYYKDFARIPVTVPPKRDQQRIGHTLSTMDRTIAKLEKLIAAKRTLKKGLAQQLLTGKRRLPGFRDKWKRVTVKVLCNRYGNGATPSTNEPDYWSGSIPWITGADFQDQSIDRIRRYVTERAIREGKTRLCPRGQLLVVTRTNVGKVAIAPFDIAVSQDVSVLELDPALISPRYALYAIIQTVAEILRFNQGTSIKGITMSDFLGHTLLVPKLSEQAHIAVVLGAADREIVLLEKKLASTRQLKKGLMQKLIEGGAT